MPLADVAELVGENGNEFLVVCGNLDDGIGEDDGAAGNRKGVGAKQLRLPEFEPGTNAKIGADCIEGPCRLLWRSAVKAVG